MSLDILEENYKQIIDILRMSEAYSIQCDVAKDEHFLEGKDRSDFEVDRSTLLQLVRAEKYIQELKTENERLKCNKDCCIHCGSSYCTFVDEVKQLKQQNEKLEEKIKKIKEYFKSKFLYTKTTRIEQIMANDICEILEEIQ